MTSAFVVASHAEAKQRLHQLTLLHAVRPFDLSDLSPDDDRAMTATDRANANANGLMNGVVTSAPPAGGAPHRELPVDCPAHFVGVKKEPPRYPPPSLSSSQSSLASARRATKLDAPADSEEASRIRRYEEELRRRREDEARAREEEDFLRASLRGSKRLRALQENVLPEVGDPPSGIVNPNYTDEEGGSKASTLPIRRHGSGQAAVQLLGESSGPHCPSGDTAPGRRQYNH